MKQPSQTEMLATLAACEPMFVFRNGAWIARSRAPKRKRVAGWVANNLVERGLLAFGAQTRRYLHLTPSGRRVLAEQLKEGANV